MGEIIDGKLIAAKVKSAIKERADEFEKRAGRKVGLAVIIAGDDPASQIYVRNKIKACEQCNIASYTYRFDSDVAAEKLIELIDILNVDRSVDGILIQLPLPNSIDARAVLSAISPLKDADGFHVVNAGKLFLGEPTCFSACTPLGIMELIDSTGVDLCGKHAVVVGRSNTVGKPVAMMLLSRNATVTVCHSKTANLGEITRTADILVAAVGKKKMITADMVKRGAIVIDVGMNRDETGLYGDVDFESVKDVCSFITPVPGGVGPMTVAMLLKNTVSGAGA